MFTVLQLTKRKKQFNYVYRNSHVKIDEDFGKTSEAILEHLKVISDELSQFCFFCSVITIEQFVTCFKYMML